MNRINSKLKVAVLAGGIGTERQISIQSGDYVMQSLKEAGLNVIIADIRPDDMKILEEKDIGVFFLALHGKFGEDGQLQQILEDKSLIYTGSGPAASRLAFDKMASKKVFVQAGASVAPAIEFKPDIDTKQLEKRLRRLGDKYVIKPVTGGSSVGVSITDERSRAIAAAQKAYDEFGDCMIERFIPGRLVTVGILCGQPLPIIEIKAKRDFYDYQAKYVDEQTEYLFDTITERAVAANIEAAAFDCFDALGLKDFARIDFILGDDGIAYVLEANSIPGLTSHSLLPKAAAKTGLSMSDLCIKIIEAAPENKNQILFSDRTGGQNR